MTRPTPIWVTKSPRPTEESNLGGKESADVLQRQQIFGNSTGSIDILAALVVRLAGVLDETSVLDGDSLALLGLSTGALDVGVDRDAHFGECGVEAAGKGLQRIRVSIDVFWVEGAARSSRFLGFAWFGGRRTRLRWGKKALGSLGVMFRSIGKMTEEER